MKLLKDDIFFRHVNDIFTDNLDFFIEWFWLVFGATRIQIGSKSTFSETDPDPTK